MTPDPDKIFPDGMAQPPPDPAAVRHVMAYFGGQGGRVRSERKAASSRANLARARRGMIIRPPLDHSHKGEVPVYSEFVSFAELRRIKAETATLAGPTETREARP